MLDAELRVMDAMMTGPAQKAAARGEFYGLVTEEGALKLDHRDQLLAYARRKFRGHEIVLTIAKRSEAKTRRQEAGYHAMIHPWARDEGHRIEDLKHFCLEHVFGLREVTNPITGEVRQVLREPHTSTLTKQQYSELIEQTIILAAECGVILQAPSEYREQKEKAQRAAEKRAKREGRAA